VSTHLCTPSLLRCCSRSDPTCLTSYAGHLSPDGSLFVYQSPEPGLQVCDLASSSQVVSFSDSETTIEYPRNIRFMYSGDWLLTSGKGKLSLWHVASRTSARVIDLGAFTSTLRLDVSLLNFSNPSVSNHSLTHMTVCQSIFNEIAIV
jgi:WD40 repeat protein